MAKSKLGDNLKAIRSNRSLTQAQMAEVIGISLRYYQDLEAGAKDPSYTTVTGIIEHLKLDPGELFGSMHKEKKQTSHQSIEPVIILLKLWSEADEDTREEALDRLRKGIELASDSPKRKLNHIR